MKIISSPAKLMKLSPENQYFRASTPYFIKGAEAIQHILKTKSPKFLSNLMEISQQLADENWERNQRWNAKPKSNEASSALFTFTGEVYRALDAKSLHPEELDYLQTHFRILSGLYGLLKPSDKIMLYRLEMGRNLKIDTSSNLYVYWGKLITERLNSELKKNELILNLASQEYSKVIVRKELKGKIIDVDFKEKMLNGKTKTIAVYAKHARGLCIRFCAETQAKTINDVIKFNKERYFYDEDLSTPEKIVFVRNTP